MDDNSWEQRCCDTDGASRHLGGQRGPRAGSPGCPLGPRVVAEKERFCHACSFHPKPSLAILQLWKSVHDSCQGFDTRNFPRRVSYGCSMADQEPRIGGGEVVDPFNNIDFGCIAYQLIHKSLQVFVFQNPRVVLNSSHYPTQLDITH